MNKAEINYWYVLYTRPRWEKKIASKLSDLGIECYCPLNKVERYWSDRKKIIHEPLFSCYLFVNLSQIDIHKPLTINGVLNFVHRMKKPAKVRDEEIDAIKRFLSEHDDVSLEKIDVEVNDIIEITHGPFMDHKGQVTLINQNFVKVAIKSLGYSLVATVNRKEIKKIETDL